MTDATLVSYPLDLFAHLLLPVRVGPKQTTPTLELRAEIDTGSQGTQISTALVERLRLPQVGFAHADRLADRTRGIVESIDLPLYEIALGFPDQGATFPFVDVLACDLQGRDHDVILGLDVLAHCGLVLDGPANTWHFRVDRTPDYVGLPSVTVNGVTAAAWTKDPRAVGAATFAAIQAGQAT